METLDQYLNWQKQKQKPKHKLSKARITATGGFYERILLGLLTTERVKHDDNTQTHKRMSLSKEIRRRICAECMMISRVNKEVPYSIIEAKSKELLNGHDAKGIVALMDKFVSPLALK